MSKIFPKVSIIVPVYNAGERFMKCMDTLVNQTLHELEIILVLDCPTDGTDEVAKEYASKDDRIVIVENKTNLHIGNSRNEGLKIARGEYIGFSDHDDYRELNMYEELYSVAKTKNYDIVLGVNVYIDSEGKISKVIPPELNREELNNFLLKDLLKGGNDYTLTPLIANVHPNLYKSSFLKTNYLSFVDTKKATPEDRIFQLECLLCTNHFIYYDKLLYYHILHKMSAINDSNYFLYKLRINGKMEIYNFLQKKNKYSQYKIFFYSSVKKEFSNTILSIFFGEKKIQEMVKCINQMKSLPFTVDAYRNAHVSLKKYRIGGRISRIILSLWMKIPQIKN